MKDFWLAMRATSTVYSRNLLKGLPVHLGVFLFYLAVAVGITWPLVTVLATRFAGFGYSDAYEMAQHIWWFKYALQHGQPLFYQTMMGYPGGIDGITLWSNVLQFFPAWLLAFALPLPVASNVMILVTLALDGWAMYFLARYMTGQVGPALLAGIVLMAFPTLQGHLGAAHAGLLVQWPLPLFVYSLLRLRETARRRYILFGALLFVMTTWAHSLQLIFTLMPVTSLYLLMLGWRHEWRALRQTLLAVLIGGLALGLFLIPVVRATLGTAAYTDEGGAVRYSADLLALVTPSFFHPIFGQWEYTHRVLGINLDEGAAYFGIVAALLSAVAVWKRPEARGWLVLALIACSLSLGPLLKLFDQPVVVTVGGDYPTNITLPWAAVESLPLFKLARTPGRFNFTLALAAAALAGLGASVIWTRIGARRWRWLALVAAMALILFEYQTFWPLPLTTANIPDQIRSLASRSDLRAVFDSPWSNLVAAKEGLYLQTGHVHPLIAGQTTRQTPVDPAKLTVLEATYDPALLREAGADIVIIHRRSDGDHALEDRARAMLGEPFYKGDRFTVFLTPPTTAAPQFVVVPPSGTSISDTGAAYLYAPADGWARLRTTLAADGRDVALSLDGRELARWSVAGRQSVDLPLPLTRGYHTVALSVLPACPQVPSVTLRCRAVSLSDFALDGYTPAALGAAITFDHGVSLSAARVTPSPDALALSLVWQFAAPLTADDIRFVHVLDADGRLIAQDDHPLGVVPAGVTRVDTVSLTLPAGRASQNYRVTVGWYRYPSNTRFSILSDTLGAPSGEAEIGTFEPG